MSSIVLHRYLLQFEFVLSRGLVVCARRDGMLRKVSPRAYSRYKFEHYPEDPMAFVAELSHSERKNLKDCLESYAIDKEDHVEKPSNRKLRLGK